MNSPHVQTVSAPKRDKRKWRESERMRLAFDGWFARKGHQFAITPEPRDDVRKRIALHAYEAGWMARSARTQKRVIRQSKESKQ